MVGEWSGERELLHGQTMFCFPSVPFQDGHELLPSHEGQTSLHRLQQEQQMI